MEWNIGCSGYKYPDWKRIFYPEDISQRKWFEYYCEHFNTLELNETYYKFPRLDVFKKWNQRSPDHFTFSVKAPYEVTQFKKFKDGQQMLSNFNGLARDGLGDKLAFVLFQFPGDFQYERERLDRFVAMLDPSVRIAVEFRHDTWWNDEVYSVLTEAGITFCGLSHPTLPNEVVATSDVLYYRLHGVPHIYNSKYETDDLEQMAQAMLNKGRRKAFVYFNNTADGHAITNAKQLQEICELVH